MDELTFKGEDFDEALGEDIGPAIVSRSDGAVIEDRGWMTRSQAKELANRLGLQFGVDGMTDEELEEFKRQQGHA